MSRERGVKYAYRQRTEFMTEPYSRIRPSSADSDLRPSLTTTATHSTAMENPSEGFCFANLEQLENLARHGWLTLIDSTHKTNKHG